MNHAITVRSKKCGTVGSRSSVASNPFTSPMARSKNETAGKSRWTWLIPLGLVALLVLAFFFIPSVNEFGKKAYEVFASGDEQQIRDWVNAFGAWGIALLLALMLLQTVLAAVPSVLLMVVAVLAYGPMFGGALAWTGMLLAATLGYAIGRGVGVAAVDRLIGASTEKKMTHFVERYGTWGIIVARISPALSTDAVSIGAGLVGMRFLRFILATAAGTMPLTILVAWLGSEISRLKTGLIWVSILSIAAFLAYVFYDHRKRRKAPNSTDSAG